jgi:hypothetical protein
MVAGRATEASNYTNYAKPVLYTIYAQLQNYIPAGGVLEVTIPKQIHLVSSPFTLFRSSSPNLVATDEFTKQSFKLKAADKVAGGALTLTFGGVRNPVSYQPTDVFKMTSTDADGFAVGSGNLDNIVMSEPALFTNMTVTADNETNGAVTDYTVSFSAPLPLYDGDRFNVLFPSEIKTPRSPLCEKVSCLDSLSCTGEAGRIVVNLVKLAESCGSPNSAVAFKIRGLRNPPSMVASRPLGAYWTSSEYRQVANFSGAIKI